MAYKDKRELINSHGWMYVNAITKCISDELKHLDDNDELTKSEFLDKFDQCLVDAQEVLEESDEVEEDKYDELVKAQWG